MIYNSSDFKSHYFTEDNLNEILGLQWLAGHWKDFDPRNSLNFLRKIAGSTTRKIVPKQYNTTPISQMGYSNIFGKLTADFNNSNKERLKFYIKDLFNGKWNVNDAPQNIADALGQNGEIESTAVYRLNNGGAIILYHIKDDDGDDAYFVGIDGSGEKYFAADKKKGGLGMLFKSWLAAQKSQNVFNLSDTIKGSDKKKKSGVPFKIEIDKNDYLELVPNKEKMQQQKVSLKNWKMPLAASVEYDTNLYDLFIEAENAKKVKYIFKNKDGKWMSATSAKNTPEEVVYNPKYTYVVVDTEEPVGSKTKAAKLNKASEELQKEFENSNKEEVEDTKDTETANDETTTVNDTSEPETVDNAEATPDSKPEINKTQTIEMFGTLAADLGKELKLTPNEIEPTAKVASGWRYQLKNNGVIFVYQGKDNKYYIGFDYKAKPIADKLNLINTYGLTQSLNSPE